MSSLWSFATDPTPLGIYAFVSSVTGVASLWYTVLDHRRARLGQSDATPAAVPANGAPTKIGFWQWWATAPKTVAILGVVCVVTAVGAWGYVGCVIVARSRPQPSPSSEVATPTTAPRVIAMSTPSATRTPSLDNLNGAWVGVSNRNICHKIVQKEGGMSVDNYDAYGKPIYERGTGVVKEHSTVIFHMRKQSSDHDTRIVMTLRPPSESEPAWHLVADRGNDWTYVGTDCPKPTSP